MHPDFELAKLKPAAGLEVSVGLGDEGGPVFDGAGQHAHMDEIEGFVAPGVLDVVNLCKLTRVYGRIVASILRIRGLVGS